MKKLIFSIIGIFVFVIVCGLSVAYIRKYACDDVNKYLAGVQESWGITDKDQQFQFTPWDSSSKANS